MALILGRGTQYLALYGQDASSQASSCNLEFKHCEMQKVWFSDLDMDESYDESDLDR